MRLVARIKYNGEYLDSEIKEMHPSSFEAIKAKDVTGIPVYWSKVGSELRFWPLRNPAYCEVVDLDHE
jgi:hypothetical protein